MLLVKENVIKILKNNFNFSTYFDEFLGEIIVMSPFDAYIYSAVTGHGYLDSIVQPFSPNGLMQIFNQANAYNLVTGMLDRDGNLYHTPFYQARSRPYLINGEKYIVPVEYDTNSSLQKRLKEIIDYIEKQGKDPRNFIACRIKKSTSGYAMEPFLEYVATKFFNGRGYLTETQIPFYYSGGTPDFAAYYLPDIRDLIKKNFKSSGASFIGLASIRVFGYFLNNNDKEQIKEAIVGEAKTSSLTALNQIKKYLKKRIFNKAYEIIPHKTTPGVITGLLTFDNEGFIKIYEAKVAAKVDSEKQKVYLDWLRNYIKYFLIANLSNEELDKVYSNYTNKTTRNINDLINFINDLRFEEIIKILTQYINGRKIRPNNKK